MAMKGLPVGPPRLPELPLSTADFNTLQADLTALG